MHISYSADGSNPFLDVDHRSTATLIADSVLLFKGESNLRDNAAFFDDVEL